MLSDNLIALIIRALIAILGMVENHIEATRSGATSSIKVND